MEKGRRFSVRIQFEVISWKEDFTARQMNDFIKAEWNLGDLEAEAVGGVDYTKGDGEYALLWKDVRYGSPVTVAVKRLDHQPNEA